MSKILRGVGVFAAMLLITLTAAPSPAAAAAATETKPTVCRMGIYVMTVHKVLASEGTYDADFWMWSICPHREDQPLKTLQILNAETLTGGLDTTDLRGNVWWSTRFFSGTFRQDFNLANYPFDHQTLDLQIEESALDDRELLYAVDPGESDIDPAQVTPGWKVSNLTMMPGVTVRHTTFGDPSLPNGTSGYASAKISLKATRTNGANFIKATFPLYIAAFLALICMGFDVVAADQFLGRMGALGGILFVVVFSFVSVDQLVGSHQRLFFMDKIHFAALALILLETGWSLFAHRSAGKWTDEAGVRRWDRNVAFGLLASFLATNAIMVMMAVRG